MDGKADNQQIGTSYRVDRFLSIADDNESHSKGVKLFSNMYLYALHDIIYVYIILVFATPGFTRTENTDFMPHFTIRNSGYKNTKTIQC